VTDLSQLLNNRKLDRPSPGALNPTFRDRVLGTRDIEAEFSPRLNDKPLARVLKEHLRRTG
jgi:hypothetical protein